MTPPALRFVADVVVDLGDPLELGPVLTGRRRIIPIVGGTVSGPEIDAQIQPGGADWQIVAADGTAIIDTRYSAVTADGAVVYLATSGFRHGPADVLAKLADGHAVAPGAYSFHISVRVECAEPRLAWVNRTVFVALAERHRHQVTYSLFALENPIAGP